MVSQQQPAATGWCLYLTCNKDSSPSTATKDLVAAKRQSEKKKILCRMIWGKPSAMLIIEVKVLASFSPGRFLTRKTLSNILSMSLSSCLLSLTLWIVTDTNNFSKKASPWSPWHINALLGQLLACIHTLLLFRSLYALYYPNHIPVDSP